MYIFHMKPCQHKSGRAPRLTFGCVLGVVPGTGLAKEVLGIESVTGCWAAALRALLAAAAAAIALNGCSHTAPYYRPDLPAAVRGHGDAYEAPAGELAFRLILIGDAAPRGSPNPCWRR